MYSVEKKYLRYTHQSSKSSIGIFLLDLGTHRHGEEHERTLRPLGSVGVLLLPFLLLLGRVGLIRVRIRIVIVGGGSVVLHLTGVTFLVLRGELIPTGTVGFGEFLELSRRELGLYCCILLGVEEGG